MNWLEVAGGLPTIRACRICRSTVSPRSSAPACLASVSRCCRTISSDAIRLVAAGHQRRRPVLRYLFLLSGRDQECRKAQGIQGLHRRQGPQLELLRQPSRCLFCWLCRQTCNSRMPDMHKKALFTAQKTTISHTADAHGGFFLQFHRSSCSPLEVFDLHNLKGPGFPVALFFCYFDGTIGLQARSRIWRN